MRSMCYFTWLTFLALAAAPPCPAGADDRPNVILVMTDDQGYGDLGVHGNPLIKTPHLDQFAEQSASVERFYVCPVCAPTRAGLMTGRYNYRTGVTDTWLGRAMMHADEVTLAEMLGGAGYHTAIFGKWHLGDSYPMRPQDQGFDEVLVHKGGGLCQPAGPPNNSYFDPVLEHNGRSVKTDGYCSDVYTDAAIRFIKQNRDEPFFVYLPHNCPHAPFQIAETYSQPYEKLAMTPADFPAVDGGHALDKLSSNTPAVYGMVTNIDDNFGRLMAQLDELKLADNTIVIFLTDNGANGIRYNAGMKAHKGSVYEGGIRVPFYIRWPKRLKPGTLVEHFAAHIDVVPTILEACGVEPPEGVHIDGRSVLPLLEGKDTDWPDRTYFVQWHRGDAPEPHRAAAVRTRDWKLVQGKELYDMRRDPLETRDVAAEHPEVVKRLRAEYEAWLADVSRDHGYEAPRILIGTEHENPTILTRQDWRGPEANWNPKGLGYWELAVPDEGTFEVTCDFRPLQAQAIGHLKIQGEEYLVPVDPQTGRCLFTLVKLRPSQAERLETWLTPVDGRKVYGASFVHVERVE